MGVYGYGTGGEDEPDLIPTVDVEIMSSFESVEMSPSDDPIEPARCEAVDETNHDSA
jgi:hypothetical protein